MKEPRKILTNEVVRFEMTEFVSLHNLHHKEGNSENKTEHSDHKLIKAIRKLYYQGQIFGDISRYLHVSCNC